MLKFFKGVEIMYHSRWKNSHRESGLTYGDRLYKNNTIINFKSYLTKEKINYAKQVKLSQVI